MTAVYVATALRRYDWAQNFAAKVLVAGHTVTSRWHSLIGEGDEDPTAPDVRRRILNDNLEDMARADVLCAITGTASASGGFIYPRATYCEIGWFLARGKPVVWITNNDLGRNIFDAHPLVTRVACYPDALEALRVVAP